MSGPASTDTQLASKLAYYLRICDSAAPKGQEFLVPAILGTLTTFGNVMIARLICAAYLDNPGTASPSIVSAWVLAALDTSNIYPDSPTFKALCAAYYKE